MGLRIIEVFFIFSALWVYSANASNATYSKGDALPEFDGKLRLFSKRFCPYAHRTTLVLNAKQLDYDTMFIGDTKPEWYTTINPLGTVPALELAPGASLFDADIINVYLDEEYPDVPLRAADPLSRARDKMLVERLEPMMHAYSVAAYHSANVTDDTKTAYFDGMDLLQNKLTERGKQFLHDDEPGLVDYTVWPWLERVEALPLLGHEDFALDKTKYNVLTTYMENMKQVPAVMAYLLPPEEHAKYIESRVRAAAARAQAST